MKVTLLTVGKTAFGYIKDGMAVYEKRLDRYLRFSRVEIPALQNTSSLSTEEIKSKEAELILKKIAPGDRVILLDEKGSRFTSTAWASHLEHLMSTGTRSIVFVIGGAYGFSDKVRNAAHETLSLSDMTFSHQIIRLFFEEQLYRAMTIIKGEPYHNE
ncbi:MAG TPA: 23S rRNA (pseudouridine(1915)-N(3))-methyltransferase RlmH [Candidatus Coprenecus stercoravium]|uniref:Ribosomal RNA large subunit methyltransferase H n=1 Tax=Candidatus Coprenecus stercoravium TaxID=2840735 RepID=A0A9D2GPV9_9BACT|nr:23S rRNA (pseudouridine(1915)-N(3))-methyltransferase RlmH [Candidatus Coprenecus stercoravium]